MSGNIIKEVFGGQFVRVFLTRNWKLVLYAFFLAILYISLHFEIIDMAKEIIKNESEIKRLKTEYALKNSDLLHSSRRSEVENMLKEKSSTLQAPKIPPTRIKQSDYVR